MSIPITLIIYKLRVVLPLVSGPVLFKKFVPIITALLSLIVGITVFVSTQYDFKTLDGRKWTLSQLEGQWLIVNHFAEWCAPCLEEIPELNTLDSLLKDKNIQLFAVSYDQMPKQELTNIKHKYGIQFKLIEQSYAANLPGTKPKQLPATYLISPDGEHVETVLGKQTAVSLLNAVPKVAAR